MEHFTLAQNLQTNQKTNAGFKSTSLAEDTHKTRLHKKQIYAPDEIKHLLKALS